MLFSVVVALLQGRRGCVSAVALNRGGESGYRSASHTALMGPAGELVVFVHVLGALTRLPILILPIGHPHTEKEVACLLSPGARVHYSGFSELGL